MAAFQPCPGIAELVLQVTDFEGDVAENVLHVSNGSSSAWSLADLTTLANGIDTWTGVGDGAGNKYTSFFSTADTLTQVHTRDLTTATGPEFNKTVSHAGADTSAKLQAGISKAITFRSGLAGRSQRGRAYMFGLCAGAVSSGDVNVMDATKLANIVLMWNSLIAAVTALHAGWTWVVLSRYSGVNVTTGKPIPRANGIGTAVASVGYSHTAFDYQRRRAPYHARHH